MEQAIEDLLLQLDSETLNRFPCFYDRPDVIQFRIGLNKGPHIIFHSEIEGTYILIIKDENDKSVNYEISKDQFQQCQNISSRIRNLCMNNEYIKMRDDNLPIMISTLVAAIKPVIAKKYKF